MILTYRTGEFNFFNLAFIILVSEALDQVIRFIKTGLRVSHFVKKNDRDCITSFHSMIRFFFPNEIGARNTAQTLAIK